MPGVKQMEWMTKSDWAPVLFLKKQIISTGLYDSKNQRLYMLFWYSISIGFLLIYGHGAYESMARLDILVQCTYFGILMIINLVYINMIAGHEEDVRQVLDGSTTTYDYHSKLLSEYIRSQMKQRLKTMQRISKIIKLSSTSTFLFFQVVFALEVTVFKTFKTMFPIFLPIDLDNPWVYWVVVFFQEISTVVTIAMANGLLVICYLGWTHISLEIDTLKFAMANVKTLMKEKLQGLDNAEKIDARTKENLSHSIYDYYVYNFAKHHSHICRYFEALQNIVAIMLLFIFIGGLITYACVGLALLSDNIVIKLKFLLMCFIQNAVIYGWCYISQDIADESEDISMVVSGMPWWEMPIRCRSTLLIIMIRCKKPLMLKSCFAQMANNETFTNMLSNAYRFFSVVYQMKFTS